MKTIEIKLHRKLLIAFIILLGLTMIGTSYYIFTSDKYASNNLMKLLYIGCDVYFVYSIYKLLKRLSKNDVAIVISQDLIAINDGTSEQSYKWEDILDVSISNNNNTWYLTLQTYNEEKKVSISWLDKSPTKIKNIIDNYRSNAAMNVGFAK